MNPQGPKMQQLPPEIQAEMRRRLAAGEALPSGVVPRSGMGIPGETQSSEDDMCNLNPIPTGDEGIAIVREHAKCAIIPEARKMQHLIPALMQSEADGEEAESAIKDGLYLGINGTKNCVDQLKTRVMCTFSKDETLSVFMADLAGLEEKLQTHIEEIKKIETKAQKLLTKRYDYVIKNFGLAPEKEFYRIDEEKGVVENVRLDCTGCKGATKMRKARQKLEEVQRLQSVPERDKK